MIIQNFPYLLWHRKNQPTHLLPMHINPQFNKLMDLVGKAIKEGKAIKFVYKNNKITVSWED